MSVRATTQKRKRSQSQARANTFVAQRRKLSGAPAPRFRYLLSNYHSARVQSTRVELIYSEWGLSVNPAIASTGVYVFAANGLFDPNVTGVGHQPTGFDQYMALYNEYVVVGSVIKVEYSNSDANNLALVGIFLEDLSTGYTDWRRYVENGNGVWTTADKLASGSAVKRLNHRCDVRMFSKQNIIDEDSFSGTNAANPDDTHFYHCVVAPSDGAADNGAVILNVEIRYDVIFRDPAQPDLS